MTAGPFPGTGHSPFMRFLEPEVIRHERGLVGVGVPTIDLRVDYLRPARRGDLVATGRTLRVGRTVSVADVEVRDASGALVAAGRGVYASPRP